ncbi:hypothetical protein B9Z55_006358 [Caenorhabditis nigoni]|uniref:Uncharacterized protein n=1 Tax=Caenorhabditis nigoni TaxID=1611254 RepID=A0A2G5V4P8_9PELO|nr:hypothetical protein B9Z55_006358 [Caenorhabditis nigoni]
MVIEASSWKMDALSFLDNYYPAPRDSQPSMKIAPSFFGDVKEPIVVVGSPGIEASVQTTLTGPIHLCPFKDSVELFRKQLQIQKENTTGAQNDINKINANTFKKVESLLGKKLCKEMMRDN